MENISNFLTLIWIWRKRKFRNLRNRKLRRFWVRPVFTLAEREQQGAYSNLVAEMRLSDDGTFENFHRMSPIVFDELLRIIGPLIAKVDVRRPPILPQVFSIRLTRKQIPIRLAFAITINKAQGQTFNKLGIYLPAPVFSHGQLYVAFSRVRKK